MAEESYFPDYLGRKSPAYSKKCMVASNQIACSEVGLDVLRAGGNAMDAAIAMVAVLGVIEPCSNGIGGDCFMLYYDAKKKKCIGINGSGRASRLGSLEKVKQTIGSFSKDPFHALSVTVPGAISAWITALEEFGSMNLRELLRYSIKFAEEGFIVSPITSLVWKANSFQILKSSESSRAAMQIEGRSPRAGEIMKNPLLAKTLRKIAEDGAKGFYTGEVAESIIEVVTRNGGILTLQDLEEHKTELVTPIKYHYKGIDVYEIPPNDQGIVCLIALGILKHFNLKAMGHNSAVYIHHLVESLRLAFADAKKFVHDPLFAHTHTQGSSFEDAILNETYLQSRAHCILPLKKAFGVSFGKPFSFSDTVSFQVVDSEGNSVSLLNSTFQGFGTGLIPEGQGFTLHNRGSLFSCDEEHSNCYAANKRPYHTIIPGMSFKDGEFHSSFSCVGGFMQPQGHLQILLNQIEFSMDPQAAIDAHRFCISPVEGEDVVVHLERGFDATVISELRAFGHTLIEDLCGHDRALFGRAQLIRREFSHGEPILAGGSDSRGDGCAIGF